MSRLPEQEYLKLAKLVLKQERKFAHYNSKGAWIIAERCLKKVTSLIKRMAVLEFIMAVPEERRFTNGYK